MNLVINKYNSNYDGTINFKSKIKFVSYDEFKTMTDGLSKKKHFVGYPWTPDTIKTGKNLYTNDIQDCIAGGIVDNSTVKLFHLCTRTQAEANYSRQKGFDIAEIARRLFDKINLENENLHGFIIGGFNIGDELRDNYNKLAQIKRIFEDYNIPYTIFGGRKNLHKMGRYGIFYNNKQDTWFVTNTLIGRPTSIKSDENSSRKEMEIKGNHIFYNKYTKDKSLKGNFYNCERKKSDIKTFLEQAFTDVELSKFDTLM